MRMLALVGTLVVCAISAFGQNGDRLVSIVRVEDAGSAVSIRFVTVTPQGTRSLFESVDLIRKADVAVVTLSQREDATEIMTVRVFLKGVDAAAQPVREYSFLPGGEQEARTFLRDITRLVFR